MKTVRGLTIFSVGVLLFGGSAFEGVARAATPPPPPDTSTFCQNVPDQNPFTDVGPGTHHDNILCLSYARVTQGTTSTTYDPTAIVRRDQMATFMARAIDEMNRLAKSGREMTPLPSDDDDDDFWDDVAVGSTHHQNIGRLFEANIVNGTGPRTYNPSGAVTRAQMATFINRSEEYLTGAAFTTTQDFFTDDDGNTHEDNVNAVASVGIAQGKTATTYGPDEPVTREQMASFLIRWFAVHEARGDITPLPADVGPDLVSVQGLDANSDFAYNQGDRITLTFANPVGIGTTLTITDEFGTRATLTDASPAPAGQTEASFVLSNGGRTLTITPTEAVQFANGTSFGGIMTITDSAGITDVDAAAEWNPDKEPIKDVQFEFEQPA